MRTRARIWLLSSPLLWLAFSSPLAADDLSEREALISFFHATNGSEWENSQGWLSDEPICGWFGVDCCYQWCDDPGSFGGLELRSNNLTGYLPSEIRNLQDLKTLDLAFNQIGGTLPDGLFEIGDLEWIDMSGNQFSGSIPPGIGDLTELWFLSLGENQFSGALPVEFEALVELQELNIGNNHFVGEVPYGIWELPQLWVLFLAGNQLSGELPIGVRPDFQIILSENRFSGPLPRWILGLPSWIGISYNAFHTADPEIEALLKNWHYPSPDWLSTQTVAPDTVELAEIDSTTLRLSWSGGGPQDLAGRTVIEHALSGEDWATLGETPDRGATTFDLVRPDDALSHHYRLRTVTDAHENNQSTLVSDPSEIVTLNSAGHRIIPAVARVQGAGAWFTTTLHAFNPGAGDLEMLLTYTPRSDIGGQARSATWTLGAGEAQTIDDALEVFFGPFGDEAAVGTLLIAVNQGRVEDLLLRSVITAEHDDGRQYGQAFESPAFSDALQAGTAAFLHLASGRMRTNSGLAALEPGTRAQIRLVGPIGTPLSGAFEFDGEPGESIQLNDIAQVFDMDPPEDALLEIEVCQGSLIAYGSILDGNGAFGGTSDPTTVGPFTEGREIITLLEMGDIIGHEEWSGTAFVSNTTGEPLTITAQFHQRGLPGVTAESAFELQAGASRVFENLVSELFGLDNVVGTITLETDARGVTATGREYAVDRNTQGEITGTSGQLIRGLTTRDALWPDSTYHLIGLSQDRRPAGSRANLAAFNPVSTTATVTLELFDQETGQLEGTFSFDVRGEELVHLNAVIKEINPDHDESPKRIEVTTTGPVYLQAFQVNSTGDPVTVDGVAQE